MAKLTIPEKLLYGIYSLISIHTLYLVAVGNAHWLAFIICALLVLVAVLFTLLGREKNTYYLLGLLPLAIYSLYLSRPFSFVLFLGMLVVTIWAHLTDFSESPLDHAEPSDELSEIDFVPTLLLCMFTGVLGVHRFFVGKKDTAIAMLLTIGGLGIWTLIDFIQLCMGNFRDGNGRIVKYQAVKPIADSDSISVNLNIPEEIKKYAELKDQGIISEDEFAIKKSELLQSSSLKS